MMNKRLKERLKELFMQQMIFIFQGLLGATDGTHVKITEITEYLCLYCKCFCIALFIITIQTVISV